MGGYLAGTAGGHTLTQRTLILILIGVMFGIGALAYIYYEGPLVWRWWFPDQPFSSTVKRYVIRVFQALVLAVAT
jgi:hypothetical protein